MTIELKDLVKIDKRFENSVNLYLDLDNREKIDNYVYTRSSQRIIDYYIDNVNKDREHATMLIRQLTARVNRIHCWCFWIS